MLKYKLIYFHIKKKIIRHYFKMLNILLSDNVPNLALFIIIIIFEISYQNFSIVNFTFFFLITNILNNTKHKFLLKISNRCLE